MKNFFLIASLVFAFVITTNVQAQKFPGLDKSPVDIATYPASYKVSEKMVKVVYGRPQLKGRTIGKDLAKFGKVWRTGANEAAEITFYTDVVFGGKKVTKGTYSLFTIPNADSWTIILNKNLNQWGAYAYDEKADVVRVDVESKTAGKKIEAFAIAFDDNGSMHMAWGKTRVVVAITK
ncbi:MAG: DUF2911 domain-containing protein [Flavobacteriaceae bacterium]|nr:DUF2911 domain-containing protein [Flavobacteriaceae bacterium]